MLLAAVREGDGTGKKSDQDSARPFGKVGTSIRGLRSSPHRPLCGPHPISAHHSTRQRFLDSISRADASANDPKRSCGLTAPRILRRTRSLFLQVHKAEKAKENHTTPRGDIGSVDRWWHATLCMKWPSGSQPRQPCVRALEIPGEKARAGLCWGSCSRKGSSDDTAGQPWNPCPLTLTLASMRDLGLGHWSGSRLWTAINKTQQQPAVGSVGCTDPIWQISRRIWTRCWSCSGTRNGLVEFINPVSRPLSRVVAARCQCCASVLTRE